MSEEHPKVCSARLKMYYLKDLKIIFIKDTQYLFVDFQGTCYIILTFKNHISEFKQNSF